MNKNQQLEHLLERYYLANKEVDNIKKKMAILRGGREIVFEIDRPDEIILKECILKDA